MRSPGRLGEQLQLVDELRDDLLNEFLLVHCPNR
jgi:hypothetical protein